MKDRVVAALLAFLLGGLGVHKFYLGKTGQGILYLLFCWTFIPSVVAFFEAILLVLMEKDAFDKRYNPDAYYAGRAGLARRGNPHQAVMEQADLLLKFKELHSAGAITDEEFEVAKRRALGMREPNG